MHNWDKVTTTGIFTLPALDTFAGTTQRECIEKLIKGGVTTGWPIWPQQQNISTYNVKFTVPQSIKPEEIVFFTERNPNSCDYSIADYTYFIEYDVHNKWPRNINNIGQRRYIFSKENKKNDNNTPRYFRGLYAIVGVSQDGKVTIWKRQ
ncbi:hypothetical protein OZX74_00130 [Bifidobacterium sp. ESL0798]|uniref:hypothetical protein n=1 Tax=Bifidobacterium sp. ESL0798 TaxID=2983235 RepID=UPI0023F7D20B|nr:hypothetical protein [Bifidobacterium sp. ESL0798]WEV74029.1 hypothetical protein OZX74_00130 [Bifidobacterium sp. ESL0798]